MHFMSMIIFTIFYCLFDTVSATTGTVMLMGMEVRNLHSKGRGPPLIHKGIHIPKIESIKKNCIVYMYC